MQHGDENSEKITAKPPTVERHGRKIPGDEAKRLLKKGVANLENRSPRQTAEDSKRRARPVATFQRRDPRPLRAPEAELPGVEPLPRP